jgi:PAS domain S-box-containing protein
LKKVDNDWAYVDAGNRYARYVNLAPGIYTFSVKGSNNDGTWNEEGKSLKIIILPPFWQEWWFRILAGIFLIASIYAGYQWRTKRLRKSRDEMEKAKNLAEFRNAENEKLMAAIASIFIAVDADGKVSQWNQPSEKFFGMTATEAREQSFVELLKDYIPIDKLDEIMHMGLHRDKAANNVEIPVQPLHRGKDKDPKLLLANINPIMDRSGKTFGFILLAEDITYQKEEEMQRFLSQKLEALGQMAAGIAHEIRSPLQYIGDNSQFLMEAFGGLIAYSLEVKNSVKSSEKSGETIDLEKLNQFLDEGDFDFFVEEIPKAAEQIVTGVTRVSNIVQSMNEFAYTGDGVEDKSDLNELLKSTLVVAHNRIKKVADLETDYAPNLPPVPCSMGELNQVFLNLLINAADAIAETGKRGIIKITTRRKENELLVEISDTGIGIPDDIKDKIFTPFFTTKKVGQGTGQGLHFSYRIVVERLTGKLYFKSKVNGGTTFYVHLPIEED